jgi:CBS domain-containing protein
MITEEVQVESFMSKNLVRAFSDSNVLKAVHLMVDHNIGSIVVEDQEGPIGLFTERDLISKVLGRGRSVNEPVLLEVTTEHFETLKRDATLVDAAKLMLEKKSRLIVFDDGSLIGIVTATDVMREIYRFGKPFDFRGSYSKEVFVESPKVKVERIIELMDRHRIGSVLISDSRLPQAIFTERNLLRAVVRPDFRPQAEVGEYATWKVLTAEEGIDGLEAAAVMADHHIKRLPLTRSGEIVGMVTARDLVEGFARSAW